MTPHSPARAQVGDISVRRVNGSVSVVARRDPAVSGPSALPPAPARGRRHGGLFAGGSRRASCPDAFLPYRRLAMRVIDQALRDLASPAQSASDRESARAFLAGSPMLDHWCEVAEIDPRWLVVYLKANGLHGPRAEHVSLA